MVFLFEKKYFASPQEKKGGESMVKKSPHIQLYLYFAYKICYWIFNTWLICWLRTWLSDFILIICSIYVSKKNMVNTFFHFFILWNQLTSTFCWGSLQFISTSIASFASTDSTTLLTVDRIKYCFILSINSK